MSGDTMSEYRTLCGSEVTVDSSPDELKKMP